MLMLLLVISVAVKQSAAQQQVGDNLLTNSGFEGGHYNQDNIPQIAVPNGWRMHWIDGVTFAGAWDSLPAFRPETVVWNSQGGIPAGEELLWRDGIYTLKLFKSWAPMWTGLSQDVTGLQVGRRYRFITPVFVDVVKDFDSGNKVPPDNPEDGQVRLGAGATGVGWRDETAINYSGWWTGNSVPGFYQNYNVYIHDFTATSENMTVWVEVRSMYPHANNGFFLDGLALYALDEFDNGVGPVATIDPNAPTPTPIPTATPRSDGAVIHIVQSGDTFWNIAIQYASTLGVEPGEALTLIQDANNNPAFINAGQELIIVPPPQQVAQPTSEPLDAPTAEPENATEETAETEETGAAVGLANTESEEELQPLATPAEAAPEGGGTEAEQPTTGVVCVSAFDDTSGDGVHDKGNEVLLISAALTLSRGGNTVSTYVSDGNTELHCFEDLEPDTYQIQFFPPADYRPTTQDNGWIAVSAGATMPVAFGAQFNPTKPATSQEVAAVNTAATAADSPDATAADAPAEEAAPEGNFLTDNLGTVILGVAVFLIILAGIGVVMLRRG